VGLYLADDAPLRGDMERFGHRHLVALTLERDGEKAEVIAQMKLNDGSPLTERYDIWTHDTPPVLDWPPAAREAAFMIAIGISGL
jgi:hypothetical protein